MNRRRNDTSHTQRERKRQKNGGVRELPCREDSFARVFTPLSLKICAPYARDDDNDDAVIAFGSNNIWRLPFVNSLHESKTGGEINEKLI